MGDLASVLHTYGGWGISAVCLVAIWRMANYIGKLHAERQEEAKAAIETQREETRATVTALVETRNALGAFKEAMEALARRLES